MVALVDGNCLRSLQDEFAEVDRGHAVVLVKLLRDESRHPGVEEARRAVTSVVVALLQHGSFYLDEDLVVGQRLHREAVLASHLEGRPALADAVDLPEASYAFFRRRASFSLRCPSRRIGALALVRHAAVILAPLARAALDGRRVGASQLLLAVSEITEAGAFQDNSPP